MYVETIKSKQIIEIHEADGKTNFTLPRRSMQDGDTIASEMKS